MKKKENSYTHPQKLILIRKKIELLKMEYYMHVHSFEASSKIYIYIYIYLTGNKNMLM